MPRWIFFAAALAWSLPAAAQGTADGDRVMTVVRAALAPALPFPDTDQTGSVPATGSPEPLWMVRVREPGARTIEVMANPLNEMNQARAARAMAQIGAAIDAAQKRAELQYERAVAEAKRTGRSQDVDGVGLSDEGVAGARIDAEAHVTIDVDFNQPSYVVAVESSVAPAPSRQITIAGAVAIVAVPSNIYRTRTAQPTDENYCPAETMVYFGALAAPEVRQRSEHGYEITASAVAVGGAPFVRSMAVRFRGNEVLIAEILQQADWNAVLELLK
ncbi:MAG: hypothetical protein EXQ51_11530 [Acidobacteria bacterium]|nr:hypothetical protein [Acidobacteriota bacterium]